MKDVSIPTLLFVACKVCGAPSAEFRPGWEGLQLCLPHVREWIREVRRECIEEAMTDTERLRLTFPIGKDRDARYDGGAIS